MIRIRTLRHPSGRLCEPAELCKLRLEDTVAGHSAHVVYAQITHDRDLLLTLRTKRVSELGKRRKESAPALIVDNHILKISVSNVKSNAGFILDNDGDQYLPIDRGSVIFELILHGQSICRPAISQSDMYFMQSNSTDSIDCQPHFVKASISDGSTRFSVAVPQIAETGRIYNNGKQVRPKGTNEIQDSTPDLNIKTRQRDLSLLLTNDERFCIWSDFDDRIYIFCTNSGSLLYTLRHLVGVAAWALDRPLFKHASHRILDGKLPVELRVNHGIDAIAWNFNVAVGQERDPFCTMSITPLTSVGINLPIWLRELLLPGLDLVLISQDYYGILQAMKWHEVTLPSRHSQANKRRLLEFEMPLIYDYQEEVFDIQIGYATCWMPKDGQLLIVDFWPSW